MSCFYFLLWYPYFIDIEIKHIFLNLKNMALQLLQITGDQRKARNAIHCRFVVGNNVWNKACSSATGECVSFAQKKASSRLAACVEYGILLL